MFTSEPLGRAQMLARLRDATIDGVDVVVVGAGITGAGVALDAVTRGYRVLLVDRDDIASGTSSKSSKLVHGGLRYLQQGETRLVAEALRERRILMRNAPHLVEVLPFLLPILTRDGLFPRRIARALGGAMWMYDMVGGWRIGRLHRRLRATAAHRRCPTLDPERLAGAYLYFDATADDARLTLDVARTAAANGAIVLNHCPVTRIDVDTDGRISSVVLDTDDGPVVVPTRCVVNAAGVWAERVDGLVADTMAGALPAVRIRPARGVHITVPWELVRNEIAVVLPVPGDRRSIFLVPDGPRSDGGFDVTYVGTTDTDHDAGIDSVECTPDDVAYLLRALNINLDTVVGPEHVTGVWAGLRPLVESGDGTGHGPAVAGRTADLSRRHRVDSSRSGLVRVIGGKLTTYRAMAADTVDAVDGILGGRRRCRTRRLRIQPVSPDVGAAPPPPDPGLADPLAPGTDLCGADVIVAVRHELAGTLVDVMTRRHRGHLLNRAAAIAAAEGAAALLAAELGWDRHRTEDEIARYMALCDAEAAATGGTTR
ncbi:MAG: glycerol-3-phosphate dehydrogenase/oxidase [Ilumatobacteraceae bacterium]